MIQRIKKVIHKSAYIDKNTFIGDGTNIWHFCHVSENVNIGKNCTIGQNVFIGKNVKIGNNVKLQNNVSVYEGVELDDDVFCGPSCVFTNVNKPRTFINQKNNFSKTKVNKGCSIGANATIICGNNIGMYSFIGAGSLVNRDINDFSLVYGNPSKFAYWIDIRGNRLDFKNSNQIYLKKYKETYKLTNNKVELINE